MASTKQMAANRTNARRSSGPRSALGKNRSSLNALKHGLSANGRILDGENAAEFERLQQELMTEFEAANTLEAHLVEELGMGFWKLRRAAPVEAMAICARRAESKPEELQTREDSATHLLENHMRKMGKVCEAILAAPPGVSHAKLAEITYNSTNPAWPNSAAEPAEDPNELFLRQVGVMFSQDASLSDCLLKLDRYETTQLNCIAQKRRLLSVLRGDQPALRRAPARSKIIKPEGWAELMVLPGENPAEFRDLCAQLQLDHEANSRFEGELLNYLGGILWRLQRIPVLERSIIEVLRGPKPRSETDGDHLAGLNDATDDRKMSKGAAEKPEVVGQATENLKTKNTAKASLPDSGLAFLHDSQNADALSKLSRHQAALTNRLTRTLQLLFHCRNERSTETPSDSARSAT